MKTRTLGRRSLLRLGAGAWVASGLGWPLEEAQHARARAGTAGLRSRAVVAVVLEGGVDPLALLPPRRDPAYFEIRKQTAERDSVPLSAEVGLHPGLHLLQPLFARGKLLAVTCAGSTPRRNSHGDAQRALARSLAALAPEWKRIEVSAAHASIGGGTPLAAALAQLARGIRSGESCATLVCVPGFDTHVAQRSRLARSFATLGRDLAAFACDLGTHFDRTLVTVVSEFGRTIPENRTAGTGDGLGGAAILLGGAVAGGRVTAPWPDLHELTQRGERVLPVQVDLGDMLADLTGEDLAQHTCSAQGPLTRGGRR